MRLRRLMCCSLSAVVLALGVRWRDTIDVGSGYHAAMK
jgi:hypothetical protein